MLQVIVALKSDAGLQTFTLDKATDYFLCLSHSTDRVIVSYVSYGAKIDFNYFIPSLAPELNLFKWTILLEKTNLDF